MGGYTSSRKGQQQLLGRQPKQSWTCAWPAIHMCFELQWIIIRCLLACVKPTNWKGQADRGVSPHVSGSWPVGTEYYAPSSAP